ncbi:MAG: hypothetical protein HQ488_01425 [Parcubacteria group bacterium]|nr:hypothetical protein [Parcubacteria group bacterium]
MAHSKYPRSLAKHIRTEKAKIRRTTQNKEEQDVLISALISRIDETRPTT